MPTHPRMKKRLPQFNIDTISCVSVEECLGQIIFLFKKHIKVQTSTHSHKNHISCTLSQKRENEQLHIMKQNKHIYTNSSIIENNTND